ncbi:MAG: 50S ribosomal protein L3 N(5)-glutamine methyltransferase [Azoarcus sp.]|jgi:ribosomal protein L3 glutamine methyltransferase|nr:50S ribosomal protein L3 N(5)-glutamine methyltransferase [Azoarcus sp.]
MNTSKHPHRENCDCGCAGRENESGNEPEDLFPPEELITVRDWLRYAVSRFNRAGIHCGHGVDNTYDEAAWLILATLALPLERLEPFLDACLPSGERLALFKNIEYRAVERIPTAYLVNEAWLGSYRFYVDERVIVPRSYFAELLEERFAPWIEDPETVACALDLCTGSGCLAVVMADAFPKADIVAADLSAEALAVAQRNVDDYGLGERVELLQSDLFSAFDGRRFELIVCNPPYVTAEAMANLPPEYLHEPTLALAAADDGLDAIRRLLAKAARHLYPKGLLVVEVGHNRHLVENAFPGLPFTWISTRGGEDGVFLLRREDLPKPPENPR